MLWALSDVSLSIPAGTTIGVIGPNGCGKSTLLQLIAGVLEPDGGRVTVTGRVTSLLELGAGFSPELTGRENVYLNASLHGVPRDVVRARFDAIVAFAELERFIDMPVRTYSSGMYMRLGFAVAVHLDPEIVLIDEAFAVGDAHFQRKCLHTIRDFQREGRTIVLVSHDLHLVEQLVHAGGAAATGPGSWPQGRRRTSSAATTRSTWAAATRGSAIAGAPAQIQITARRSAARRPAGRDVLRTRDALTIRLHYTLRRAGRSPGLRRRHPSRRRRARDRPEHAHERLPGGSRRGRGRRRLRDRSPAAAARALLRLGRGLRPRSDHARSIIASAACRSSSSKAGPPERLGVIELGAGWRQRRARSGRPG